MKQLKKWSLEDAQETMPSESYNLIWPGEYMEKKIVNEFCVSNTIL